MAGSCWCAVSAVARMRQSSRRTINEDDYGLLPAGGTSHHLCAGFSSVTWLQKPAGGNLTTPRGKP